MTAAIAVLLEAVTLGARAATLTEVADFGPNPGNLRMFKYVPNGLPAQRPLIVALHGCTQGASAYDNETGWTKFADKWRFSLLLPEQKNANNFNRCFNWFEPGDTERDQGEALSIKQMIDKMKADNAIDAKRIYVTGLSAGGGMASVLLAIYPEVFAGGAVIACLPYRCATGLTEALTCMNPGKDLSPAQWGRLVLDASHHAGPWPRISIWHGSADTTVVPANAAELVEQWTHIQGIDRTSGEEDLINGHPHKVYKDANGRVLVETFTITGMGHGTPIAPGPRVEQCGSVAPFILDVGICSSYHIAKFWGLDEEPTPIPNLRDELLQRIQRIQEDLDALRSVVKQKLAD